MSWPVQFADGLYIHEMTGPGNRGLHVRKHLLNRPERWDQLTTLTRKEIDAARRRLLAEGLALGPEASAMETPTAASVDVTQALYLGDYMPAARMAIEDALHGVGELLVCNPSRAGEGTTLYILSPTHVVVVCHGPRRQLRWRTAYRLRRSHRPTASLETIHRRHVRSLRRFASLQGGSRPGEDT